MAKHEEAGMGDPYWYEWSVGQSYVLDMLDPTSNIISVTLQKSGEKGLDDVVVRFANGDARFIQVKHTRAEDTLTFGDLVKGEGTKPSLLEQLANAWQIENRTSTSCEAWLVTNRAVSHQRITTTSKPPILRPALEDFLAHLNLELAKATTVQAINMGAAPFGRHHIPMMSAA